MGFRLVPILMTFNGLEVAITHHHRALYTVSQKKLDPFSFEHNFYNLYCPILTILSLLQTELSADKHVIEFDAIPVVCRCIIFRYEIHTLLHRNC